MRSVAVAAATAARAGTGASWSPKWSGMSRVLYPRSSALRACSAQERAEPSGALLSCAAKRNLRSCAMPPCCRRSAHDACLQEAEVRHPGADSLEELALGTDQLLGRPLGVARDLAHRLERADGVDVAAEDDE